ncbi:hypothetical protein JCM16816_08020 [Thermoanaerobacter brockii subsp. lactiethylicus]
MAKEEVRACQRSAFAYFYPEKFLQKFRFDPYVKHTYILMHNMYIGDIYNVFW